MTKSFDVFLSHNSKDKPAVRELAEALRARGLKVWLDEWELAPGYPWQEALEEVIETTQSAAVLVGKDGIGPWQTAEMRGCLSEFVERKLPVIPVLLPGAPEAPKLPIFLKGFTWVDLREGLTEEGIDRLQWGAIGKRPDRSKLPSEMMSATKTSPLSPRTNDERRDEGSKRAETARQAVKQSGGEKSGVHRTSRSDGKKALGYGASLIAVALSAFLYIKRDDLERNWEEWTRSWSQPRAGEVLDGPLGIRMRYVPSGIYTIGSPDNEAGQVHDEIQHEVRLTRGVWLAETELTQRQWNQLIPKNPSKFEACGADCPVNNIDWYEAVEFANRLSDQEGLARCYHLVGCTTALGSGDFTCESATFTGFDCPGYRLPTEAEWEVAARAGTTTAIYTGALTLYGLRKAPELDPVAWYGGNSRASYSGAEDCSRWRERQHPAQYCGPHPVGQKQANPWGFRDMLGNAWEWTGDWYGEYPTHLVQDPTGPPTGVFRIFRGGSWSALAHQTRAAYRYRRDRPSFRGGDLGLRLASCFRSPNNPRRGPCAAPFED